MKVNSKKKGNKFERDICKFFTEWTGYEFSRVPQSGGLRWKNTQSITSDVICTDDFYSRRWPFSIECKFHKEINFEHLLLSKKPSKIEEFWKQAQGDALRGNKKPLLIMRYNGMPKNEAFIVCDKETQHFIQSQKPSLEKPFLEVHYKDSSNLYIYLLSEWKRLDPKDLAKKIRKRLKNEF